MDPFAGMETHTKGQEILPKDVLDFFNYTFNQYKFVAMKNLIFVVTYVHRD